MEVIGWMEGVAGHKGWLGSDGRNVWKGVSAARVERTERIEGA